jgi:hypothetical protein
VWVDRDARRRFGDSSPWKEAFVAIGLGLALFAFTTGVVFVEGIALLGIFLTLAYVLMQAATESERERGLLAVFKRLLQDVARTIGMDPAAAPAKPLVKANGSGRLVVLLKKEGGVYGSRDASGLDREVSQAVSTVKAIIGNAIICRATDIHMEPRASEVQLRFRVDGLPMQNELVRKGRRIADEILGHCGLEKPLDGKRVVLLGTLLGLDREDSIGFLSNLGATVQASANLQTQYLIQGSQADPMEDSALEATGKVAEALQSLLDRKKIQDMESRQKDGQPIRIISQRQLLAMLPAGLQSVRGDV